MGQNLMNCCKPEQVGTRDYGKMSNMTHIFADGRIPARESSNWKIRRIITRNEFEAGGFMAQKGQWNLAKRRCVNPVSGDAFEEFNRVEDMDGCGNAWCDLLGDLKLGMDIRNSLQQKIASKSDHQYQIEEGQLMRSHPVAPSQTPRISPTCSTGCLLPPNAAVGILSIRTLTGCMAWTSRFLTCEMPNALCTGKELCKQKRFDDTCEMRCRHR